MQIELMGCTSAGKSTLASRFVQAGQSNATDIVMADEFVLRQIGLSWIANRLVRTLLIDLCAFFACLLTWRRNAEFYRFSIAAIWRLPRTVPPFEKLNLARNVLKKVGIYEIVRRRSTSRQVVLVDEGTLQAAHNLFVHVTIEPDANGLSTFARLVPVPDIAIYVTQPERVLIERTSRRGHKRIPDRSAASIERFIHRAVQTFDDLIRQLVLEQRLLPVDAETSPLIKHSAQGDFVTGQAFKISYREMPPVAGGSPPRMAPALGSGATQAIVEALLRGE